MEQGLIMSMDREVEVTGDLAGPGEWTRRDGELVAVFQRSANAMARGADAEVAHSVSTLRMILSSASYEKRHPDYEYSPGLEQDLNFVRETLQHPRSWLGLS